MRSSAPHVRRLDGDSGAARPAALAAVAAGAAQTLLWSRFDVQEAVAHLTGMSLLLVQFPNNGRSVTGRTPASRYVTLGASLGALGNTCNVAECPASLPDDSLKIELYEGICVPHPCCLKSEDKSHDVGTVQSRLRDGKRVAMT